MGFELTLKRNARQRATGVVGWGDADHDAGVGVALVSGVLAHAIGDHAPFFGRGRHHRAARAHAKAVNRPALSGPVHGMVHQLVVGRAQQRVPRVPAEPGAVDQALRVLNAKTDGKRLGFHEHTALMQHDGGVAGAVAQRQHHMVGAQFVSRVVACFGVQVLYCQPANSTAFNQHVAHALLKADLTAQGNDLLAHVFDHLDQLEGADVRFADQQNLRWCAGLDELQHHLAAQVARVLDLAPQLAV